ncbi:MAG: type II toxin-antitoxin system RelE/ParE family toxin [Coriobacteriia bacterium]|nr:type II toxin-antitoxin system RelE/ParE family toxin [Coriobacteriia bacterium]MCL2536669.1 type II toxin-antitoxin system RelE/ParE family toxin [Coriobacteriia bacterium]
MEPKFTWSFDPKAEKQFKKLDAPVQKRLLRWLETNIHDCENPRLFGRALEGEYENLWRYKVGKFRIIADINDGQFRVLVVKVGSRANIYKK